MYKPNCQRKNCKDVFHAFLVENASYAGIYEFPVLNPTYEIPSNLISFSKSLSTDDYNRWVHFYEDDYQLERLWRSPVRYLDRLSKFKGIILPDFSTYRDMPYAMQIWNIYRSRAIGNWLQNEGISFLYTLKRKGN